MTIRQLPVPEVWEKKCPARRTSSTVIALLTLPVFSSTGRVRCSRLWLAPEASCLVSAEAGSGSPSTGGEDSGSGWLST